MASTTALPPELNELTDVVHYVTRHGCNEYSSSCPSCGGEPHQDGTYPDRFRLWLKSRTTGAPMGWCRRCGHIWLPGQLKKNQDPLAVIKEQERWRREQVQVEQQQELEMQHALTLLQAERRWEWYHTNLTPELRAHYYRRGLDDYWIDYWQLGYVPDRMIFVDGKAHRLSTLTIPLFAPLSWTLVGIKHRILQPVRPEDRYRSEIKGLPAALFVAEPAQSLAGTLLVVEGEFKAMTVYIALDDPQVQVVGLPGKTPSIELINQLREAKALYLCLDPDAYRAERGAAQSPIERLVQQLQRPVRVMELPGKIDDLILQYHVSSAALHEWMKDARVVTRVSRMAEKKSCNY